METIQSPGINNGIDYGIVNRMEWHIDQIGGYIVKIKNKAKKRKRNAAHI